MVRLTAKRSQPTPADAHFLTQDMMKVKDFCVGEDGLIDTMDTPPSGSSPASYGDVLGIERPGEAPTRILDYDGDIQNQREEQGGMVKVKDFGVEGEGLYSVTPEHKAANEDDNYFMKSVMLTMQDISYFANQV